MVPEEDSNMLIKLLLYLSYLKEPSQLAPRMAPEHHFSVGLVADLSPILDSPLNSL